MEERGRHRLQDGQPDHPQGHAQPPHRLRQLERRRRRQVRLHPAYRGLRGPRGPTHADRAVDRPGRRRQAERPALVGEQGDGRGRLPRLPPHPRPDLLRQPHHTVTGTTFTDTTAGTTTHLYEVRAVDKSGNTSAGTADVSVTGNPTFLRQYFANTTLTGTPKRTDTDTAISENWGSNSPGVSGVGKDNFGVRWQITRDFGSGGPFTFTASGQDGIRVYLDGVRHRLD
uniref:PA14 domain-containing protein n=1 Tax=Actinacidiphila oryziradicis TaxID=2571141 RepID=UPI001FEB8B05|nr:PA14 domain-containing protein [Actinacidiphila oryziradicis]